VTTSDIGTLALANIGMGAGYCSVTNPANNSLGGRAFESSCTGNNGSAEFWCADFAKWVWQHAGNGAIDVSELNAAAASFYTYGQNNGTLHTSATYQPQVGDAVVYNMGINGNPPTVASHVGLVTSVNSDGSIGTANGDFGGTSTDESTFAEQSTVVADTISASQVAVGSTPTAIGMTISGYVTPVGLTPASYKTVAAMPVDATGATSGGFAVWAVDSNGTLWNGWQSSAGSAWSWAALHGGIRGTPVVEPLDAGGGGSGGFAVWAVDTSGNLWNGWQTSAGSTWSWADLGGGNKGTPAVTVEPVDAGGGSSGGFALWLVDGSGRLMNGWQTSAGSSWHWASLGGGMHGTPAVEPVDAGGGSSGGFAAWAVDTSGNLWNGWQTSRGSGWDWADLGGGNAGTPAVTVEPVDAGGGTSGGFAVWLVDGSGRLMNGWQASAGSAWSWAALDSGFQGTPAVEPVDAGGSTSGGFAVWAVDTSRNLWSGLQASAGSGWTWASLDSGLQGTAAAEPVDAGGATSGGFTIWAVDGNGVLWNGLQTSPGSAWTWANVGAS
jgi:hypothetical protein